MIKTQAIFTSFLGNLPRGRRRKSVRLFALAGSAMLGAAAASAAPVILNQPFSAHPGDVITLEGSGFGSAPTAYFKQSHQTTPIALATKAAVGGGVVVEVPKTAAFDLYSVWIVSGGSASPSISLNAPVAMHFDNAEIASGAHFRLRAQSLRQQRRPGRHSDRRPDRSAGQRDRYTVDEQRLLPRCRAGVRGHRRPQLSGLRFERLWLGLEQRIRLRSRRRN